jgi:hypothetical protein
MESKEEVTQSDLIRNYNNLATRLGLKPIEKGGVCYGLTLLFLDHAKKNTLNQFFEIKKFLGSLPLDKIKKIAHKAKEKGDTEDFLIQYKDLTLSWATLQDHIRLIDSAQEHQNDLRFLHTSLEWEGTFIVGIYDGNALENILVESSADFIQLGSGVHACAIRRMGSSYLFYDPNNPEPIKCGIGDIHDHVLSSFSSLEDLNTTHYTLNTLTSSLDPVFDQVIARFIERFEKDKNFDSIFMSALADYKENKISVQSLIAQFVKFVEKKRGHEISNANEAIDEIKNLLHSIEPSQSKLIGNSFQFIHVHFQQLAVHKTNIQKILSTGQNKTESNQSLHRYLMLIIARGDYILLEQVINIIKQLTQLDLNSLSEDFENNLVNFAAKFGNINCIEVLARHGMQMEQTVFYGYGDGGLTTEPLFLLAAARAGQVNVILKYLSGYNSKIERQVIAEALKAGQVEIITALLETKQGYAGRELRENIQ